MPLTELRTIRKGFFFKKKFLSRTNETLTMMWGHRSMGDGEKIVINDGEKAEVFNKYFCSVFGKKWSDTSISYNDDEPSSVANCTWGGC